MYEVAVYEGSLAYGGPEEGGWWYWQGELVGKVHKRLTREGAHRLSSKLNKKYPTNPTRTSVRPTGPDFQVVVRYPDEHQLIEFYPPTRPHFE